MKRTLGIVVGLVAVLGLLGVATASAAAPNPSKAGAQPEVAGQVLVAVAIGQLREQSGDTATIDLRGHVRGGRAGGTLRFYSPDEGYYNGAIRRLSVENGTIKAAGGGGLWRPDGTRVVVRYTFEASPDGQVKIVVKGRGGLDYELSGRLDPGVVKAGPPPAPTSTPTSTAARQQ